MQTLAFCFHRDSEDSIFLLTSIIFETRRGLHSTPWTQESPREKESSWESCRSYGGGRLCLVNGIHQSFDEMSKRDAIHKSSGASTPSENSSSNHNQSTSMVDSHSQQAPTTTEGSQRVEVATLRLPPEAYREGIRTGEGTNVILEHHPEGSNSHDHANNNHVDPLKQPTTMPVIAEEEELPRHWNTNIEAVVDLQAMQKLVTGATEQEFHSMLRRTEETDSEVDVSGNQWQTQPLQPSQTSEMQYPYEETTAPQTTLELSADPFVDTLTSLQQQQEHEQHETHQINFHHGNMPPDEAVFAETTLDEEDQSRYAHEGFLLSVQEEDNLETGTSVSKDMKGDTHSYVLALPQIMPSEEAFHDREDDMTSIASKESLFQHEDNGPYFQFTRFPEQTELPTDIVSVELRATVTDAHSTTADTVTFHPSVAGGTEDDAKALHLDLVVERKTPMIGYLILGTALVAMSSMGAAVNLMGFEANAILKNCWRIQATVCCLLPMALTGKNNFSTEVSKLTWVEWTVHLPLCGLAFFVMSTAFVVALEMTSLANVFGMYSHMIAKHCIIVQIF